MKVSSINNQPVYSLMLNIPMRAQASVAAPMQSGRRGAWRKFVSESARMPNSHYDELLKTLQERVRVEEVKRKLEALNREIDSFDRDLFDPGLGLLERELKKIMKPFLYQKRSVYHFLLGNLDAAIADERTFHSMEIEFFDQYAGPAYLDYAYSKYSNYYGDVLNDQRMHLIVDGVGKLLAGEEKGIESLNRAASSGNTHALMLLLALGKTAPAPMVPYSIPPKPMIDLEKMAANYGMEWSRYLPIYEGQNRDIEIENVFARLLELFQSQNYEEAIAESTRFLEGTQLRQGEREFFFHLRGAAHAALNQLDEALKDYELAGSKIEWTIEKALVKIRAGDRAGAKTDLQSIEATRYYLPYVPVPESPHAFANYTFQPWKLRAMMIEKLFAL